MSGYTPVAIGWSTARNWSTRTPCLAMIAALTSISSWVWLTPGDRVSVVLMNSAVRSEKSGLAALSRSMCPPRGSVGAGLLVEP